MTVGVVDTNILIHILRRNPQAITWLSEQVQQLSISPITWLEVMYGARGKRGQQAALAVLSQFQMIYLTQQDMEWAMDKLYEFRLSHGVDVMDCLIASVSGRLQIPLYTHNVKDMIPLLGSQLVVKPYGE